MREIKFRALKDDMSNYKFVYGNLIYIDGVPKIQSENTMLFHTCIKGTECEYTGLNDDKGVDIYEGDIIQCSDGNPYRERFIQYVVPTLFDHNTYDYEAAWWQLGEVIGNVHENKDLLT